MSIKELLGICEATLVPPEQQLKLTWYEEIHEGKLQALPEGLVMVTEGGRGVKHPLANAGDTGLITGPGRFHLPWGS